MKNTFKKITDKITNALFKSKAALYNKRGDGYIGEALKILIAVVLGALLLAGLYLLFNSIVLPTLSEKIRALFNYSA